MDRRRNNVIAESRVDCVGLGVWKKILQGGAPKRAKLVQITPITMVYRWYIYSYWAYNQFRTRGGITLYDLTNADLICC